MSPYGIVDALVHAVGEVAEAGAEDDADERRVREPPAQPLRGGREPGVHHVAS